MKAVWITTADLDHVRDTEMQRELARLERHARLFRLCVQLGFEETAEGVWPDHELAPGRVTTGFLARPGSEWAQDLTTGDLERIETTVGVK